MQQENEQAPEFRDHDTRTWASFGQLTFRWEQTSGLDRSEMLSMLLQGFLCGEIWPTILPNLYGGVGAHGRIFTASPVRPRWMKGMRRFPTETFTRLDFLRAARNHLDVDSRDNPFAAGYRGLIGIPVDKYDPLFIETYIEKLTPSPNAVVRWCSDHGWPAPPGLSCSETDVSAADQEEHARLPRRLADLANVPAAEPRSQATDYKTIELADASLAKGQEDALAQTADDLKDWFVNIYVPDHKNDSPNPTRDAALSAAKPEFANYCDQTHLRGDLRNVWRIHAPKGWKRTGPRPKLNK